MDISHLNKDDSTAFKELRLLTIADAAFSVWPTAQEEAAQTLDDIKKKIAATGEQINAKNLRTKALYTSLGFETYGIEPRCMQIDGTSMTKNACSYAFSSS